MGMLRRRLGRAALCAGLLGFSQLGPGCGRASKQSAPEATVRELATALRNNDAASAYALMSKDYRREHSLKDFQKQIADNKAEARVLAEALKKPESARRYAEVTLANGMSIQLEQKDGRWLFVTPVVDFYPQGTPREALASFVSAVEAQRWDIVLKLMPEAERGDLDAATLGNNLKSQREELERMVALLKASLDSPIEEVADRATMPYGESYTVRFVREDGLWRIEDPE